MLLVGCLGRSLRLTLLCAHSGSTVPYLTVFSREERSRASKQAPWSDKELQPTGMDSLIFGRFLKIGIFYGIELKFK